MNLYSLALVINLRVQLIYTVDSLDWSFTLEKPNKHMKEAELI